MRRIIAAQVAESGYVLSYDGAVTVEPVGGLALVEGERGVVCELNRSQWLRMKAVSLPINNRKYQHRCSCFVI